MYTKISNVCPVIKYKILGLVAQITLLCFSSSFLRPSIIHSKFHQHLVMISSICIALLCFHKHNRVISLVWNTLFFPHFHLSFTISQLVMCLRHFCLFCFVLFVSPSQKSFPPGSSLCTSVIHGVCYTWHWSGVSVSLPTRWQAR